MITLDFKMRELNVVIFEYISLYRNQLFLIMIYIYAFVFELLNKNLQLGLFCFIQAKRQI